VPAYIEDDVVYVVQARAKTSEELQAEQLALAAQNERQAKQLLASTDWTQLADVMLVNKQEFATYRAQLRQIATNPQAVVTWPAPPTNVWQ
jgi:prephenate dehydrogenase